jgi:hypothetical protein
MKVSTITPHHIYDTWAYEGAMEDGTPFRIRCWRGQVLVGFGPSIPLAHMITPDCIQIYKDLGIQDFEMDTIETASAAVKGAWEAAFSTSG